MKTRIILSGFFLVSQVCAMAQPVSVEIAHQAASRFLQDQGQPTSGVFRLNPDGEKGFTLSDNGIPCLYMFNLDPAGFIMVSADQAAVPVVAYSFTSSYQKLNQPEGFQSWIQQYLDEILFIKENQLRPDSTIRHAWKRLIDPLFPHQSEEILSSVDPLITSRWDQDFPYNRFCPEENNVLPNYYFHVPAGCVATAMAQVMYYWRFPSQGQGNHCIEPESILYGPQCANFENTFYQYTGMIDSAWQENSPLALLIYHAGIAVDMTYTSQSSNAFFSKIPDALKSYFRFSPTALLLERSNFTASQWTAYLKGDLDDGKPVIYSGGSGWNSHAFVCDGYQPGNYFHFNWGWGGLFDGYYLLTSLNPGSNNYTGNQQAIMHIEPSVYIYPVFCSGQTTITEFPEGSIEDGSGPVKGYRNNNQCSWLINPSDGIEHINLRFNRFKTASGDLLKVYDGSSPSATLLGSFSGSGLPPSIVSSGPALYLTFESDATFNENGFQAEFTSTPLEFCQPSTFISDYSGSLSDGSTGYMYRNSTSCQWLILPFGGKSVTLSFEEFSTEAGSDKLEIVELGTGVQLALLSGDYITPPDPVTSSTGMMMILFTTDKVNRGSGWYATYSVLVDRDDRQPFGEVRIYPNPSDGKVKVELGNLSTGPLQIEVTSLTGTIIPADHYSATISDQGIFLDLRGCSSGFYFLRLRSAQGTATCKLMITRG